ncbi:MAG: hypothetical protein KJO60_15340, partial [Desulfofustis sp.]|nr:hypothetical protein [Desulfofustis sp.]
MSQRFETEQLTPQIRLRAIFIGLVFAVAICLLTPVNNVYHRSTPLGGGHFPLAPFFVFFTLALLVWLLGRSIGRRPLLSGSELLVIWIQTVIGSGIAYTGLARTFLINLTAPFHFATVGNQWQETFEPLLPAALIPRNTEAIELMYNGLATGRDMSWLEVVMAIPWGAWSSVFLRWGIFIMLSYLVMIFIINLFARQWIVNERLNFPLLKVSQFVSYAVDRPDSAQVLRNRFLLIGILVPLLLHLLNGISLHYPSVPTIQTLILAGKYFPKEGLLSGFYKLKIYIYPAFIGFDFLTSRQ